MKRESFESALAEGPEMRLIEIARIIEGVDNRCMAVDGPVSDTREEMTKDEMRAIYMLATGDWIDYAD